jgi:hypothetical protein
LSYEPITTAQGLAALADRMADADTIAFDTEFVSEDTYRSELCLIQVAAGGQLAVVDPLAVKDTAPFFVAVVRADGVLANLQCDTFWICLHVSAGSRGRADSSGADRQKECVADSEHVRGVRAGAGV